MIILSYCSPLSVEAFSPGYNISNTILSTLYLESHPNYGVKTILAKAVLIWQNFFRLFSSKSLFDVHVLNMYRYVPLLCISGEIK